MKFGINTLVEILILYEQVCFLVRIYVFLCTLCCLDFIIFVYSFNVVDLFIFHHVSDLMLNSTNILFNVCSAVCINMSNIK